MWCQSWRIYCNINQLHVWNMLHQIHKQVFTTLNQYDDAVNTKHLYWVFNRQDQHLTHLSHLVLRAHQYFTCWWFRVFGCQPITALLHVCDLESLLVVMECVCGVFSVRWCVDGVEQMWRCSVRSAESEEEDQQPATATEQQIGQVRTEPEPLMWFHADCFTDWSVDEVTVRSK